MIQIFLHLQKIAKKWFVIQIMILIRPSTSLYSRLLHLGRQGVSYDLSGGVVDGTKAIYILPKC